MDKPIPIVPKDSVIVLDPATANSGGHVITHHMAPGAKFSFSDNPDHPLVVSGQFENGSLMLVHAAHGRGPEQFWNFRGWEEAGLLMLQQGRQCAASIAEDFRKGVIHDLRELGGSAPHQTAVICGSGPSLTSFPIQKAKDAGCVIFAVNKAVQYVREKGLLDYAVVVDPLVPFDWAADDALPGSVICSMVASYVFRGRFKQQWAFSCPEGVWASKARETQIGKLTQIELPNLHWINSGLTATFAAMEVCWHMGFKNIVLAGQDFACPGWRKDYETVIPVGAMADKASGWYIEMMKNEKGEVVKMMPTSANMARNACNIRVKTMLLEEEGIKVYNASPEGILNLPRTGTAEQVLAEIAKPVEIKEMPPRPEGSPLHFSPLEV